MALNKNRGMCAMNDIRSKIRAMCEEYEERAFRRGFNHGVGYTIEVLENGGKISDLKEWQRALREWRYGIDQCRYLQPPEPPPKKLKTENDIRAQMQKEFDEISAIREPAFRQGVLRGSHDAIDAVKYGASLEKVELWFEKILDYSYAEKFTPGEPVPEPPACAPWDE